MHNAVRGEAIGKMKMKALSIALSIAFILRVVSQYALGILWEWHVSDYIALYCHFRTYLIVSPTALYLVLHLGPLQQ
jgi:hypothetical protein